MTLPNTSGKQTAEKGSSNVASRNGGVSQRQAEGRISKAGAILKSQLLNLSYDQYHIHTSSNIALAILRNIKYTAVRTRRTIAFIRRVRNQLAVLNNYNRATFETRGKYPYSKALILLLVRYVQLEYDVLYHSENHSAKYEEEVEEKVRFLLHLLLDGVVKKYKQDNQECTATECALRVLNQVSSEYKREGRFIWSLINKLSRKLGLAETISEIRENGVLIPQTHPIFERFSCDNIEDISDCESDGASDIITSPARSCESPIENLKAEPALILEPPYLDSGQGIVFCQRNDDYGSVHDDSDDDSVISDGKVQRLLEYECDIPDDNSGDRADYLDLIAECACRKSVQILTNQNNFDDVAIKSTNETKTCANLKLNRIDPSDNCSLTRYDLPTVSGYSNGNDTHKIIGNIFKAAMNTSDNEHNPTPVIEISDDDDDHDDDVIQMIEVPKAIPTTIGPANVTAVQQAQVPQNPPNDANQILLNSDYIVIGKEHKILEKFKNDLRAISDNQVNEISSTTGRELACSESFSTILPENKKYNNLKTPAEPLQNEPSLETYKKMMDTSEQSTSQVRDEIISEKPNIEDDDNSSLSWKENMMRVCHDIDVSLCFPECIPDKIEANYPNIPSPGRNALQKPEETSNNKTGAFQNVTHKPIEDTPSNFFFKQLPADDKTKECTKVSNVTHDSATASTSKDNTTIYIRKGKPTKHLTKGLKKQTSESMQVDNNQKPIICEGNIISSFEVSLKPTEVKDLLANIKNFCFQTAMCSESLLYDNFKLKSCNTTIKKKNRTSVIENSVIKREDSSNEDSESDCSLNENINMETNERTHTEIATLRENNNTPNFEKWRALTDNVPRGNQEKHFTEEKISQGDDFEPQIFQETHTTLSPVTKIDNDTEQEIKLTADTSITSPIKDDEKPSNDKLNLENDVELDTNLPAGLEIKDQSHIDNDAIIEDHNLKYTEETSCKLENSAEISTIYEDDSKDNETRTIENPVAGNKEAEANKESELEENVRLIPTPIQSESETGLKAQNNLNELIEEITISDSQANVKLIENEQNTSVSVMNDSNNKSVECEEDSAKTVIPNVDTGSETNLIGIQDVISIGESPKHHESTDTVASELEKVLASSDINTETRSSLEDQPMVRESGCLYALSTELEEVLAQSQGSLCDSESRVEHHKTGDLSNQEQWQNIESSICQKEQCDENSVLLVEEEKQDEGDSTMPDVQSLPVDKIDEGQQIENTTDVSPTDDVSIEDVNCKPKRPDYNLDDKDSQSPEYIEDKSSIALNESTAENDQTVCPLTMDDIEEIFLILPSKEAGNKDSENGDDEDVFLILNTSSNKVEIGETVEVEGDELIPLSFLVGDQIVNENHPGEFLEIIKENRSTNIEDNPDNFTQSLLEDIRYDGADIPTVDEEVCVAYCEDQSENYAADDSDETMVPTLKENELPVQDQPENKIIHEAQPQGDCATDEVKTPNEVTIDCISRNDFEVTNEVHLFQMESSERMLSSDLLKEANDGISRTDTDSKESDQIVKLPDVGTNKLSEIESNAIMIATDLNNGFDRNQNYQDKDINQEIKENTDEAILEVSTNNLNAMEQVSFDMPIIDDESLEENKQLQKVSTNNLNATEHVAFEREAEKSDALVQPLVVNREQFYDGNSQITFQNEIENRYETKDNNIEASNDMPIIDEFLEENRETQKVNVNNLSAIEQVLFERDTEKANTLAQLLMTDQEDDGNSQITVQNEIEINHYESKDNNVEASNDMPIIEESFEENREVQETTTNNLNTTEQVLSYRGSDKVGILAEPPVDEAEKCCDEDLQITVQNGIEINHCTRRDNNVGFNDVPIINETFEENREALDGNTNNFNTTEQVLSEGDAVKGNIPPGPVVDETEKCYDGNLQIMVQNDIEINHCTTRSNNTEGFNDMPIIDESFEENREIQQDNTNNLDATQQVVLERDTDKNNIPPGPPTDETEKCYDGNLQATVQNEIEINHYERRDNNVEVFNGMPSINESLEENRETQDVNVNSLNTTEQVVSERDTNKDNIPPGPLVSETEKSCDENLHITVQNEIEFNHCTSKDNNASFNNMPIIDESFEQNREAQELNINNLNTKEERDTDKDDIPPGPLVDETEKCYDENLQIMVQNEIEINHCTRRDNNVEGFNDMPIIDESFEENREIQQDNTNNLDATQQVVLERDTDKNNIPPGPPTDETEKCYDENLQATVQIEIEINHYERRDNASINESLEENRETQEVNINSLNTTEQVLYERDTNKDNISPGPLVGETEKCCDEIQEVNTNNVSAMEQVILEGETDKDNTDENQKCYDNNLQIMVQNEIETDDYISRDNNVEAPNMPVTKESLEESRRDQVTQTEFTDIICPAETPFHDVNAMPVDEMPSENACQLFVSPENETDLTNLSTGSDIVSQEINLPDTDEILNETEIFPCEENIDTYKSDYPIECSFNDLEFSEVERDDAEDKQLVDQQLQEVNVHEVNTIPYEVVDFHSEYNRDQEISGSKCLTSEELQCFVKAEITSITDKCKVLYPSVVVQHDTHESMPVAAVTIESENFRHSFTVPLGDVEKSTEGESCLLPTPLEHQERVDDLYKNLDILATAAAAQKFLSVEDSSAKSIRSRIKMATVQKTNSAVITGSFKPNEVREGVTKQPASTVYARAPTESDFSAMSEDSCDSFGGKLIIAEEEQSSINDAIFDEDTIDANIALIRTKLDEAQDTVVQICVADSEKYEEAFDYFKGLEADDVEGDEVKFDDAEKISKISQPKKLKSKSLQKDNGQKVTPSADKSQVKGKKESRKDPKKESEVANPIEAKDDSENEDIPLKFRIANNLKSFLKKSSKSVANKYLKQKKEISRKLPPRLVKKKSIDKFADLRSEIIKRRALQMNHRKEMRVIETKPSSDQINQNKEARSGDDGIIMGVSPMLTHDGEILKVDILSLENNKPGESSKFKENEGVDKEIEQQLAASDNTIKQPIRTKAELKSYDKKNNVKEVVSEDIEDKFKLRSYVKLVRSPDIQKMIEEQNKLSSQAPPSPQRISLGRKSYKNLIDTRRLLHRTNALQAHASKINNNPLKIVQKPDQIVKSTSESNVFNRQSDESKSSTENLNTQKNVTDEEGEELKIASKRGSPERKLSVATIEKVDQSKSTDKENEKSEATEGQRKLSSNHKAMNEATLDQSKTTNKVIKKLETKPKSGSPERRLSADHKVINKVTSEGIDQTKTADKEDKELRTKPKGGSSKRKLSADYMVADEGSLKGTDQTVTTDKESEELKTIPESGSPMRKLSTDYKVMNVLTLELMDQTTNKKGKKLKTRAKSGSPVKKSTDYMVMNEVTVRKIDQTKTTGKEGEAFETKPKSGSPVRKLSGDYMVVNEITVREIDQTKTTDKECQESKTKSKNRSPMRKALAGPKVMNETKVKQQAITTPKSENTKKVRNASSEKEALPKYRKAVRSLSVGMSNVSAPKTMTETSKSRSPNSAPAKPDDLITQKLAKFRKTNRSVSVDIKSRSLQNFINKMEKTKVNKYDRMNSDSKLFTRQHKPSVTDKEEFQLTNNNADDFPAMIQPLITGPPREHRAYSMVCSGEMTQGNMTKQDDLTFKKAISKLSAIGTTLEEVPVDSSPSPKKQIKNVQPAEQIENSFAQGKKISFRISSKTQKVNSCEILKARQQEFKKQISKRGKLQGNSVKEKKGLDRKQKPIANGRVIPLEENGTTNVTIQNLSNDKITKVDSDVKEESATIKDTSSTIKRKQPTKNCKSSFCVSEEGTENDINPEAIKIKFMADTLALTTKKPDTGKRKSLQKDIKISTNTNLKTVTPAMNNNEGNERPIDMQIDDSKSVKGDVNDMELIVSPENIKEVNENAIATDIEAIESRKGNKANGLLSTMVTIKMIEKENLNEMASTKQVSQNETSQKEKSILNETTSIKFSEVSQSDTSQKENETAPIEQPEVNQNKAIKKENKNLEETAVTEQPHADQIQTIREKDENLIESGLIKEPEVNQNEAIPKENENLNQTASIKQSEVSQNEATQKENENLSEMALLDQPEVSQKETTQNLKETVLMKPPEINRNEVTQKEDYACSKSDSQQLTVEMDIETIPSTDISRPDSFQENAKNNSMETKEDAKEIETTDNEIEAKFHDVTCKTTKEVNTQEVVTPNNIKIDESSMMDVEIKKDMENKAEEPEDTPKSTYSVQNLNTILETKLIPKSRKEKLLGWDRDLPKIVESHTNDLATTTIKKADNINNISQGDKFSNRLLDQLLNEKRENSNDNVKESSSSNELIDKKVTTVETKEITSKNESNENNLRIDKVDSPVSVEGKSNPMKVNEPSNQVTKIENNEEKPPAAWDETIPTTSLSTDKQEIYDKSSSVELENETPKETESITSCKTVLNIPKLYDRKSIIKKVPTNSEQLTSKGVMLQHLPKKKRVTFNIADIILDTNSDSEQSKSDHSLNSMPSQLEEIKKHEDESHKKIANTKSPTEDVKNETVLKANLPPPTILNFEQYPRDLRNPKEVDTAILPDKNKIKRKLFDDPEVDAKKQKMQELPKIEIEKLKMSVKTKLERTEMNMKNREPITTSPGKRKDTRKNIDEIINSLRHNLDSKDVRDAGEKVIGKKITLKKSNADERIEVTIVEVIDDGKRNKAIKDLKTLASESQKMCFFQPWQDVISPNKKIENNIILNAHDVVKTKLEDIQKKISDKIRQGGGNKMTTNEINSLKESLNLEGSNSPTKDKILKDKDIVTEEISTSFAENHFSTSTPLKPIQQEYSLISEDGVETRQNSNSLQETSDASLKSDVKNASDNSTPEIAMGDTLDTRDETSFVDDGNLATIAPTKELAIKEVDNKAVAPEETNSAIDNALDSTQKPRYLLDLKVTTDSNSKPNDDNLIPSLEAKPSEKLDDSVNTVNAKISMEIDNSLSENTGDKLMCLEENAANESLEQKDEDFILENSNPILEDSAKMQEEMLLNLNSGQFISEKDQSLDIPSSFPEGNSNPVTNEYNAPSTDSSLNLKQNDQRNMRCLISRANDPVMSSDIIVSAASQMPNLVPTDLTWSNDTISDPFSLKDSFGQQNSVRNDEKIFSNPMKNDVLSMVYPKSTELPNTSKPNISEKLNKPVTSHLRVKDESLLLLEGVKSQRFIENVLTTSVSSSVVCEDTGLSAITTQIPSFADDHVLTSSATGLTSSASFVNTLALNPENPTPILGKDFDTIDEDDTPITEKVKAYGTMQIGSGTNSDHNYSMGGPLLGGKCETSDLQTKQLRQERDQRSSSEDLDNSAIETDSIFPFSEQVCISLIENNLTQETNRSLNHSPVDTNPDYQLSEQDSQLSFTFIDNQDSHQLQDNRMTNELIQNLKQECESDQDSNITSLIDDYNQLITINPMSIEKMNSFQKLMHSNLQTSCGPDQNNFPLTNFDLEDIETISFTSENSKASDISEEQCKTPVKEIKQEPSSQKVTVKFNEHEFASMDSIKEIIYPESPQINKDDMIRSSIKHKTDTPAKKRRHSIERTGCRSPKKTKKYMEKETTLSNFSSAMKAKAMADIERKKSETKTKAVNTGYPIRQNKKTPVFAPVKNFSPSPYNGDKKSPLQISSNPSSPFVKCVDDQLLEMEPSMTPKTDPPSTNVEIPSEIVENNEEKIENAKCEQAEASSQEKPKETIREIVQGMVKYGVLDDFLSNLVKKRPSSEPPKPTPKEVDSPSTPIRATTTETMNSVDFYSDKYDTIKGRKRRQPPDRLIDKLTMEMLVKDNKNQPKQSYKDQNKARQYIREQSKTKKTKLDKTNGKQFVFEESPNDHLRFDRRLNSHELNSKRYVDSSDDDFLKLKRPRTQAELDRIFDALKKDEDNKLLQKKENPKPAEDTQSRSSGSLLNSNPRRPSTSSNYHYDPKRHIPPPNRTDARIYQIKPGGSTQPYSSSNNVILNTHYQQRNPYRQYQATTSQNPPNPRDRYSSSLRSGADFGRRTNGSSRPQPFPQLLNIRMGNPRAKGDLDWMNSVSHILKQPPVTFGTEDKQ